ncbi:SDR family NAD(P)-dependent oxidoreductase [Spiribacter sp. C176]|uniref:SDR family NAD(P)-dependent oxidoreductase n=1 Tax=Spiribacter salilacus TaxID=2664894 RepID=A0A6N7QQZ4_9GAMM|nr:SDR family NAD(P)-dependent oxidoreductase [Spiribacter salilacus]MRH78826.1 SDR family NAD(P)-dependent oxidoreductase [Spiribacter salilacus]
MNTLGQQSNVLVVGATGAIGAAFVRRLANQVGVQRVWAASRQVHSPVMQALVEACGDTVVPISVELTDPSSIQAMAARIAEETPCLHLLINAFGILHDDEAGIRPEKRLEDLSAEGLLANYQINAMAPALIGRHCLGLLNHKDRAVFASLSARVGSITDNSLGGWYAYRMSKAAQNMFTRGMAIECARRARRVICLALHPGTTDSALSAPFQSRVPTGKLFTPDFVAEQLLAHIDRAQPEDSGRFIAWDGQSIPW